MFHLEKYKSYQDLLLIRLPEFVFAWKLGLYFEGKRKEVPLIAIHNF